MKLTYIQLAIIAYFLTETLHCQVLLRKEKYQPCYNRARKRRYAYTKIHARNCFLWSHLLKKSLMENFVF